MLWVVRSETSRVKVASPPEVATSTCRATGVPLGVHATPIRPTRRYLPKSGDTAAAYGDDSIHGARYARPADLSGGARIGGGTLVRKLAVYTPVLSPSEVPPSTTREQEFTMTGLSKDCVLSVSKPTHQAGPITPTGSEVYTVVVLTT